MTTDYIIRMSYWDKKYADGFFNVSRENGFLPIRDPLKVLPNEYKELQDLINNLHVFQNKNTECDDIEKGILGVPDEIMKQVKFIPKLLLFD